MILLPDGVACPDGLLRFALRASEMGLIRDEDVGASAVLTKPFPMRELIVTAERLCGDSPPARAAA